MTKISDEDLMIKFSKGDQHAFALLYSRHKNALYRYFSRQLSEIERAEELFQETWFRVVNSKLKYRSSAKFTTWIYKIAHNLLVDEYRRKSLILVPNDEKESLLCDYFPDYDDEKRSAIKHCVSQLAPVQKEAFLLRHESGFDLKQLCEIVNAKAETVKTRLRYAMQQLRGCLSRKLGVDDE